MRKKPTTEEIARKVMNNPAVMTELFRLLAWADPDRLGEMEKMIMEARQNRADVLTACANGTFGRDYIFDYTAEKERAK